MSIRKLSLWGVLIAVACNGRLTVSPEPGSGGWAGTGAGGALGRGGAGTAGKHLDTGGVVESPAGGSGPHTGGSIGVGGEGPTTAGSTYCEAFGCGGAYPAGGSGPIPIPAGGSGPRQGMLNYACIPGEIVTEADGTPAKADIKTLDHCDEGLWCAPPMQACAATPPDCATTNGDCVVRHAVLGSGGTGGAGGAPGTGGETFSAGSSSIWNTGGFGQSIEKSTAKSGVIAMTASESRVYWVEYGTRDALGNYQHNGTLLAYSPDDGTTSKVAAGLDGPVAVEVTTTHAYIYVDGARPIDTPTRPQLLRVPLTGGTAELVQEGAVPASFAAAGSQAFWNSGGTQSNPKVYSMTSDADAVPTEFIQGYSVGLTVDGTDLYYQNDTSLMRTPIASAAPVALGMSAGGDFVVRGDDIFSVESLSGANGLLTRAPKSGGEFLRVRALGKGSPTKLRRVGDRFFVEAVFPTNQREVLTGNFTDSDPPVRLLQRTSASPIDRLWTATADALYWSEGRAVYKQLVR